MQLRAPASVRVYTFTHLWFICGPVQQLAHSKLRGEREGGKRGELGVRLRVGIERLPRRKFHSFFIFILFFIFSPLRSGGSIRYRKRLGQLSPSLLSTGTFYKRKHCTSLCLCVVGGGPRDGKPPQCNSEGNLYKLTFKLQYYSTMTTT